MDTISLLFHDDTDSYFTISSKTAGDLGVDFLTDNISDTPTEKEVIKKILLKMPVDPGTIGYRQDVYNELRKDESLCTELYSIFDALRFSFNDRPVQIGSSSTIWELLQRFRSLQHYIHSVTKLRDLISDRTFSSEGMKRFSEFIHDLADTSGFDELAKDISILDDDVQNVRSMTIGINFNPDFYPEEAGIISLNKFYFTEQSALKRFMSFHRKDQLTDGDLLPFSMETYHDGLDWIEKRFNRSTSAERASDSILMNNLTSIIERMLPAMTSKLKKVLDKYVNVSGIALADLADEMLFYLRFIEMEKKLTEHGLPCCCGESSDKDTYLNDLYNLRLAVISMKEGTNESIVCNDIAFTNEQTVQILTGPNRGGKTIITQGIGLAFLMYQSGVFVPAASAKIRICDGIHTHFPVEEEQTISLGRLGDEAERFHEICRAATGNSLLLFNESFATTSHTESLYIAEDVLKYLCCLGARTVFNTHMHELAENCEKLSDQKNAVCKAASLVMENGEDNRFKISCRKPDGKSYAHVIAQQYGITFEQLCEELNRKEE